MLKISSLEAGFPEPSNGMASWGRWMVSAILHKIRVFPFIFVWFDLFPLFGMSIASRSCIEVKMQACCRSERARFRHGIHFTVWDSVMNAGWIGDGKLCITIAH
jgi:hypothetical protein